MTTINDIQDLVRIIEEHPEWRGELQRVLLTQQLLEVPERLDRLEATVEVLAETAAALVQHAEASNARLDSIERSIDALLKHAEATDKTLDTLLKHAEATNKRLDGLEFRMDGVEIRLGDVETRLGRVEETTNALRGDVLEVRLTNKIPPLVSRQFDVRRIYPVWSDGFLPENSRIQGFQSTVEEATDNGQITDDDETRLRVTDLIVRSQRKSDGSTLWFAVEASGVIGEEDIVRAKQSSDVLKKIYNQDAMPLVYGYQISDADRDLADELQVPVFLDPDRR
ncbi:MAG: hypothetical protein F4X34_06625 [Chloroflexi bacterium]|nr:hypothetical protein [Chloroflexota bacterium]